MKILREFILGKVLTNCYLIEHNGKIILIDAPPGIEVVADYLDENNLALNKIFLTHTHYDHIIGLKYLVENNYIDSKNIYCPDEEIFALKNPTRKGNLSDIGIQESFILDYEVTPLSKLKEKGMEFRFLKGHSLQSAVYIFNNDKAIFCGDTLFDEEKQKLYFVMVPNVAKEEFTKTIKDKILTLPEDYIIYPGHLSIKTIGQRKQEERFR
ncbi:MAG: MBL fold metallo-hydrolase [Candidatus Hepatoplasma vulgare]|nr:MAG: MBL fold metallo-hydrolase [Candidatus Hepatoplasma sp.]